MSGPCGHEAREHGHHHHCNHSNDDKEAESQIVGDSLQPYIDLKKVRGLNIAEPDNLPKIFPSWEKRRQVESFVESDADEELLIFVPFREVVKMRSIAVIGGSPDDEASQPSKMKVFLNREDIDFDKANELPPTEEFSLQRGNLADMEYSVKQSKYTNVSNITLYFPANFGADLTRINSIFFRGYSTKMSTEKVVMNVVYEAMGQLKDHDVKDHEPGMHGVN